MADLPMIAVKPVTVEHESPRGIIVSAGSDWSAVYDDRPATLPNLLTYGSVLVGEGRQRFLVRVTWPDLAPSKTNAMMRDLARRILDLTGVEG